MDDERKPWDQIDGEPTKWYARFNQFRTIKPWKRSVADVYHEENRANQRKSTSKVPGDWYQIAKLWQWDERASEWDKHRIAERDKQIAAEEAEILKEEYALRHERIKDLNRIAKLLREELFDDDKRWLDDVKAVGIEPYHLKQFNDAIIREYRAILDDIAKETGERVKTTKSELSGKVDGEHVEKIMFYMPVVDEEDNDEPEGGDANANNSHSQGGEDRT